MFSLFLFLFLFCFLNQFDFENPYSCYNKFRDVHASSKMSAGFQYFTSLEEYFRAYCKIISLFGINKASLNQIQHNLRVLYRESKQF